MHIAVERRGCRRQPATRSPWLLLWLTVCVPLPAWAEEGQRPPGADEEGVGEETPEPSCQVTPAPEAPAAQASDATDATHAAEASPAAPPPPGADVVRPAQAAPPTSANGAGPGIQLSGEPGKGLTVTVGERFSAKSAISYFSQPVSRRNQVITPGSGIGGNNPIQANFLVNFKYFVYLSV